MSVKRTPIKFRIPIIFDKQNSCPYSKPYGYIYKITNKINGHFYVGKHKFYKPYLDKSYAGSGVIIKKAYKKYGKHNFYTSILEWTDKGNEELNKLEKYWIEILGAFDLPQNYNASIGGDGFGCGESNPVYGTHINSGKSNPMYGDHRFAGKNHPMYGKKHSEETKRKIGDSERGTRNGNCHPIVRLSLDNEYIDEYPYINGAVQNLGFKSSSAYSDISMCCTGKKKNFKGFNWMYKEDYDNLVGRV